MAKSKYAIYMDFNAAKKRAEDLERIAGELEGMTGNSLPGCLNSVNSNWKGNNATTYIGKGNAIKENISGVASGLRTTAGTIRTVAKKAYDAEMAALEIVKNK